MLRRYLLIVLTVIASTGAHSVKADQCYQAFQYNDSHSTKGMLVKSPFSEVQKVKGVLHVRLLDNKAGEQPMAIAWFADTQLPAAIRISDTTDLGTPFLIRFRKSSYAIEAIEAPTLDTELQSRLLGLVDSIQYEQLKQNAVLDYVSSSGKARSRIAAARKLAQSVTQIVVSRTAHLKEDGSVNKDVEVRRSETAIDFRPSSCIWENAIGVENMKINFPEFQAWFIDDRKLTVNADANSRLKSSHWFFTLDQHVKDWMGPSRLVKAADLDVAAAAFEDKQAEFLALLDNREGMEQWIAENYDFLKTLPQLLADRQLDNSVSLDLFMILGAMDNQETVDILSAIGYEPAVNETDRFRALMGLDGTTAPMTELAIERIAAEMNTPQEEFNVVNQASNMLIGSYAKHRHERVPEQYAQLEQLIYDSINNDVLAPEVSLSMAGNMLGSATPRVINHLEQSVRADNINERRVAAQSLGRIGQTRFESEDFVRLWEEENNIGVQVELVKASAVASDSLEGNKLALQLLALIQNNNQDPLVHESAAKTFASLDLTKNRTIERELRNAMSGQKNREIMNYLLSAWGKLSKSAVSIR